ncbi:hypothetical protein CFK41_12405 [Brachybacterium ginsengisoli]|uniref:Lysylphosphatidylglycerol synthetase family protein n=1 Tax=Brachybacterium ginsengisoli TaxID=1331682 RepID=A0A291GZB0_9MICO|nr:lysylphosphatidylglycerol synthase domain-containing protein [Brachybacterium ginsengisoli]ATG55482.1 hypothetical protein CFK41_12405 [Brachybacterium ginsengisoli]
MSAASPDPSDSPDPGGAAPRPRADPGRADGGGHHPGGLGRLEDELAELDAERPPRLTRGRVIAGLVSAALVIALLGWALPWATGTSWGDIAGTLVSLPAWAVPSVVMLGAGALLLEAVTVRVALPGSRWSGVLLAHPAAGATSLAIPGGGILGLGLMGWILRRSGLALPVILTGIIAASLAEMVLTSVLIPLLGLGAYAISPMLSPVGVALPGAVWAAVVAVLGAVIALALTLVLLRRGVLSALLDQFSTQLPEGVAPVILAQRDVLVEMLRRRWVPLLAPTLGARVLQWVALVLAIQAVGAEVPWLLTVAIFALGRVLSLVPLTPGGAGVTETVGAAALVALGVVAADAAAAMLLLMVTMLLVPLLAGALTTVLTLTLAPDRRSAA